MIRKVLFIKNIVRKLKKKNKIWNTNFSQINALIKKKSDFISRTQRPTWWPPTH